MPFTGDRWLITTYTLPHVPTDVLSDLGFPLMPSAPVQPSHAEPMHDSPLPAAPHVQQDAQPSVAATHHPLPLGQVNWGSGKAPGLFSSHKLLLHFILRASVTIWDRTDAFSCACHIAGKGGVMSVRIESFDALDNMRVIAVHDTSLDGYCLRSWVCLRRCKYLGSFKLT